MRRIAESDATFSHEAGRWTGKCLICNGWLAFGERDGLGANVEHIVPQTAGGSSALPNLGLTHPACNSEKGRRWDNRRARHGRDADYAAIVARLQRRRHERWREPYAASPPPN